MDWVKALLDVEDIVIPHYEFDIYERGLYLYLLNQTRLRGYETKTIPLPKIFAALNCSEDRARKTIRKLAEKGCIELEQTRKGHLVKVLIATELGIQKFSDEDKNVDLDELDFFKNRDYVTQILAREGGKCFYCLSDINIGNCDLDHVVSQVNGGDNGYRNIAASCHKCNTRKQAMDAEDYLRSIFRKGLLSDGEFEGRLSAVEALKNGDLKPIL